MISGTGIGVRRDDLTVGERGVGEQRPGQRRGRRRRGDLGRIGTGGQRLPYRGVVGQVGGRRSAEEIAGEAHAPILPCGGARDSLGAMTETTAGQSVVRPIEVAWVSTGGTGAPNYDEFNTYDEIAEVIAANPSSILTVDMPHATPEGRKARPGLLRRAARGAAAAAGAQGRRPVRQPRGRRSCPTGSPPPTVPRTASGRWSRPARSPTRPTSRAWSSATRRSSSTRSRSAPP